MNIINYKCQAILGCQVVLPSLGTCEKKIKETACYAGHQEIVTYLRRFDVALVSDVVIIICILIIGIGRHNSEKMFRDKLQICYTINVIIIIRSGRARVMLPNSDINFEKDSFSIGLLRLVSTAVDIMSHH